MKDISPAPMGTNTLLWSDIARALPVGMAIIPLPKQTPLGKGILYQFMPPVMNYKSLGYNACAIPPAYGCHGSLQYQECYNRLSSGVTPSPTLTYLERWGPTL